MEIRRIEITACVNNFPPKERGFEENLSWRVLLF